MIVGAIGSTVSGKLRTLGHKLRPPAHRARVAIRDKRVDPFYASPEWKRLMAAIIQQRGRCCEDEDHDPATPRIGVRLYGDHVIEIADGGARLDPANVLLRCAPCHGRKTAMARAARARERAGG